MKVNAHMSGPIHPESTHTRLLLNSNNDLKTSTWSSELQASSGKLKIYRLIKHEFKMEKYLNFPPHYWVPTTRLRNSAHFLRIETGRYNLPTPIPGKEPFCWFWFQPTSWILTTFPTWLQPLQTNASLSNLEKLKFISSAKQPENHIFILPICCRSPGHSNDHSTFSVLKATYQLELE